MAGLTNRLRMPVPKWGSPYTSGQAVLQSGFAPSPPGSPIPPRPPGPKGPFPTPTPVPPRVPERESFAGRAATPPTEPIYAPITQPVAEQKVEITPFMQTIYGSMKNIDPEQRADYLSNTASSIKSRLDRYEFRLARGIPLSPEQQRRYESIRAAYNDIQKYINDPKPYDEYFGQVAANVAGGPLTTNQQVSANVGGLQSSPYNYYRTR